MRAGSSEKLHTKISIKDAQVLEILVGKDITECNASMFVAFINSIVVSVSSFIRFTLKVPPNINCHFELILLFNCSTVLKMLTDLHPGENTNKYSNIMFNQLS